MSGVRAVGTLSAHWSVYCSAPRVRSVVYG